MCKVIELLNCEYIELKDIHIQQKLKDLYDKYNATITTLYYDILEFYMPNPLIKEEDVVSLAKELIAIDWDVYEDMEVAVNIIYGKHKIPLWWD